MTRETLRAQAEGLAEWCELAGVSVSWVLAEAEKRMQADLA